jgi:hypothetical protein
MSTNVPISALWRKQWKAYHNAMHCQIYQKPFIQDDKRLRDHCHLIGKYRGPTHSNCNLNYRQSFYIPVIFHNLSGYDSHFIIKEIATAFEGQIDLLPITKEKYISFTKNIKATEDDRKTCIKLRQ